jgi:D-amino peptidase
MKVYISADMEGAIGITAFQQVSSNYPEFHHFRNVWLDDINALAAGAFDAGAKTVLVNESHELMNYILPERLDPRITFISGRIKRWNQMEGLDPSFSTAFLFAHAKAGSEGLLAHSYVPPDIFEMKLNGMPIGEMGLNAAAAGLKGVPISLVIGDDKTYEEAREFLPDVEAVITKDHITQFTAANRPVEEVRAALRQKAYEAVKHKGGSLFAPQPPYTLEVTFIYPIMKELPSYIPGVNITGPRSIAYTSNDYAELTQVRILIVNLTKMIGMQVRP